MTFQAPPSVQQGNPLPASLAEQYGSDLTPEILNSLHYSQMTVREAMDLEEAKGNPYSSPNLPDGYNTVVGYFHDCYAWFHDQYEDVNGNAMQGTGLDKYEEWCVEYAERLGLKVLEVEAPAPLKVHGIMTLKAFPEALLEIRCHEVA